MVGIIKQTGTVNKNSGVVINKKMIAEIVAIIIVALVALAGIQAFQATDSQQENTQQAEQQTTNGAATSSLANGGQETNTGQVATQPYPAKFNPSGNNRQDVAINSIPAMIPFAGGSVYIKDLKVDRDYLYGYLGSNIDSKNERIRFSYIGNDGYAIPGTGEYGLEFRVYSETKKQYIFRDPIYEISLIKGEELYFRIPIPNKAEVKFVHITR